MNLDIAYANADFIPNAADFPPRWAQEAQEFRDGVKNLRLDLAYGDGPRQRLDLFLPDAPRGLVVFVHGGYWRAFSNKDWSHLAAGAMAQGWAVAMPGYTLAPEARISEITREVAAAIDHAAGLVPGPLILTGHSAGGHLVARMNCEDAAPTCADRITRIVPISPVGDLRPLVHTEMNTDFRLDRDEAVAESPTLARDRRGIATTVWVGAEERPAFLDQARELADAWDEATLCIAPGRHHFDVIEPLADPASSLTRTLLA
ncbi:alpha/beta hydrolase [Aliiroseovarius subalbicans]|uniref:alpha/beta hydrolase n=1 Tax=Aliiroseovarius subalbicans TaxID=2925840 RepID=UPI001F5978C2|nr:alpha/beta hydrolase [Aliiroseovarius subalbicans]MCI2400740.1 alpha/beta hydrolase [Aliiroseovarius subalbicans]